MPDAAKPAMNGVMGPKTRTSFSTLGILLCSVCVCVAAKKKKKRSERRKKKKWRRMHEETQVVQGEGIN